MPSDDVTEMVRAYVAEHLYFGETDDIDVSASLLDSGMIDSTGVMEIVLFIEKTFSIKIPDQDLITENLDSVESIAKYVERRRAEGSNGRDGA